MGLPETLIPGQLYRLWHKFEENGNKVAFYKTSSPDDAEKWCWIEQGALVMFLEIIPRNPRSGFFKLLYHDMVGFVGSGFVQLNSPKEIK